MRRLAAKALRTRYAAQGLHYSPVMKCMLPAEGRYLVYVEDDEEDVELFQEAASSAGLLVHSFPNGDHLLQSLREVANLPCLILLDLKNPVRSGPETYALLQADARLCSIPVKYFSNSFDLMQREQESAPGVELITKPDLYKEWLRLMERLSGYCEPAESLG